MLVYNYFENDSRVLKEAYTLADNGYEVNIFSIWKEGLPKVEIIRDGVYLTRLDFTPLHKKIIGVKNFEKLKNLVYGKPSPLVINNNNNSKPVSGFEKNKLSSIKFITNVINKFFSYKGFYIDVKKAIAKKQLVPNFVHAHDLNTLPLGVKVAKKYKSKLIYDSHELYIHRNKPYLTPKWFQVLEEKIERKNIRKCDKVITVSNSIVKYLAKKYQIDEPTLIMNAPVKKNKGKQSDENNLAIKLGVSDDKKILIYSGAISFNRGLDKIIESLAYLPNAYLVFLGRGSNSFKNYLLAVAKNKHVEDRFSFYGPVKPHEVTTYVQSAYLGIAPIENVCLSYYFCAPNKVFEYIQGEIPVVSSDFPDLKDVVEGNEIGKTFDPQNPKDIADKISEIINNKELYNHYKNGVKSIVDKYKWENESIKLLALYQQLA
jgi:glycosyltransferase involved in cell wall biosynthesis